MAKEQQPDNLELGIRFGCGAICGTAVGISLAAKFFVGSGLLFIALVVASALLIGLLAMRRGNAFWEGESVASPAMSITSRLFSFGPRLRPVGDSLVATTGWKVILLTLGTSLRCVVVDPEKQSVRISVRRFWFLESSRFIPFAFIHTVTYDYLDWNPAKWFAGRHSAWDGFDVGLRLQNQERIHLFSFIGNGPLVNEGPFPDWLYGSGHILDLVGTQQPESYGFVDVLARMIGVSVGRP